MKNHHPLIPFLGYSLLFHVIIALVVILWRPSGNLSRFVVLGAHSRGQQEVYFKTLRQPRPSSSGGTNATTQGATVKQPKKAAETKKKTSVAAPKPNQKKVAPPPPSPKAMERQEKQKKTKAAPKIKEKPKAKVVTPVPAKKMPQAPVKKEKSTKKPKQQAAQTPPQKSIEPEPELAVANHQAMEQLPTIPLEENAMVQDMPTSTSSTPLDASSYQEELIREEISRLWRPPLGVPKGTICRARFVLDKQGGVQVFEIVTRSGVLIYDLSVTRVARTFRFKEPLWGTSFEVDFKQ